MNPDTSLNQVVVVVGASSGMGRAIVTSLARSGAQVVAVARRQRELDTLVEQLREEDLAVLRVVANVADRHQVERVVAVTLERFGRADTLIYSAGTNRPDRTMAKLPPEGWDEIVATNLTGAYHCTQLFVPSMINQGRGLFIYISSLAVLRPIASGAAYQASKHGLKGLADAIVYEHHSDGIRATVLIPGLTDTPFLSLRPSPPDLKRLESALQAEDVATVCRFLVALPERVRIPILVMEPAALL